MRSTKLFLTALKNVSWFVLFIICYLLLPFFPSSVYPGQNFAGVDCLTFLHQQSLDHAGFRRANFVLHFHGFHNQKTLADFDGFAGFHENANNFSGHGRDDLLAAFGFDRAMAAAAPGAGIDDLGNEFFATGLQRQRSVWRRRDANFVRLTAKQDRVARAYRSCY